MTLQEKIEQFIPKTEQEERDKALMLHYFDLFPNLLTRENETAHFTASGWVVSRDRRQVLMAYHNIYQSWAWLGGHADGEDDLLRVAAREVSEESGLSDFRPVTEEIFSLEILGVNGHEKRGRYVPSHLHLNLTYLFEGDETKPLRVKADENSRIGWLNAEDLETCVSEPYMLPIYRKLIKRAETL